MRPLRVAAALGALAAATVCGLVAADVRAWGEAIDSGDAQFAVGGRADWRARERVPRVAGALLEVEDDRQVRQALAHFRAAVRLSEDPLRSQEREAARGAAERAARGVVARDDARAASQAAVLLGVLQFDQQDGADRAVALFVRALELDASNEHAKFDLELALRILRPAGVRPGEVGAGRSTGRPRGAGAGEIGGGY